MEIGWRLAAHAWGHGYATEAARAASTSGWSRSGLPELWSITAVLNRPSQAVMRRIGLRQHSQFEHPVVPVGHPLRPHVAYWTGFRTQTGSASPGRGPAALGPRPAAR